MAGKKFKRKADKRYTVVAFELDFIDGEFKLPSMSQVPLGIQRKLMKNEFEPLLDFIEKYGTDGKEVVEIIDTFDESEVEAFMEKWQETSELKPGK